MALSELYDNLLPDHITAHIGLDRRTRGTPRKSKSTAWELDGVPDELIAAFSTRADYIERETERLITDYRHRHGRSPRAPMVLRLRQVATLATRPVKQVRTLSEMATDWRERAEVVIGACGTGGSWFVAHEHG